MGKISLRRVGVTVLACGLTVSCSGAPGSSSTAPAMVGASSSLANSVGSEFPLLDGSFTIASRGGDGLVGVYTGVARFSPTGGETASLTLTVVSGTGAFTGASGTLSLVGTGATTGDGEFVMEGGGDVTLAGDKRATVTVALRGRSTASCGPNSRLAISQVADGNMRRAGRVEARLTHEVANTGCIP